MRRHAVLAAAMAGLAMVAGSAGGAAQTPPASTSAGPGPGTADLPRRRPAEGQSDPLRAFDIDKDGTLNLAEVKSAAAARFDELNPDGDDSLDGREAAPALGREAFRRADTNHDGVVSKAEYLAYVETLFNRANPDKDGTLDRAELRKPAGRALLRLMR